MGKQNKKANNTKELAARKAKAKLYGVTLKKLDELEKLETALKTMRAAQKGITLEELEERDAKKQIAINEIANEHKKKSR